MQVAMDPRVLVGFCLALVRTNAFLSICPPFNGPWMPLRVRMGLSMAISLVLVSALEKADVPLGIVPMFFALVSQALAGLALGVCVMVMFSGIQAAGELVDLQVGFSFGAQLDPLSGIVSAPISRLYQMVGMAAVFAAGGHVLVLRGFMRSVEAVPLGGVDLAAMGQHLLGLTSSVLIAAIEISLPLVAALFCSEVALGLLGKAAPQLNVMVLGFALKTFIAFALLGTTMLVLPGASQSLLEQGLRAGLRVVGG